MKIITFLAAVLLFASCNRQPQEAAPVPSLAKQGSATQLLVDGKPFLMLGGELGNSTASSLNELDSVFGKLHRMGLNTVLSPAYWDLIEPEEGHFDFTAIDAAITAARAHDLKIVLLWFGAWKNSMSCYAPLWVKEDYAKYPRARTQNNYALEIMTAFDNNNMAADRRAFVALMEHIARTDDRERTVIMIQVENEIGMIPDARDYHPEAVKCFNAPVPPQLTDYLTAHEAGLRPALRERWEANGKKTAGTWTELFGEGLETDEIFMAYYYGLFVEEITRAGKQAYALPMYLNAALNSRGRKPGQYPSAGPLAHLLDVWRAAAPSVDFIAPDIYDPGFTGWCSQYHVNGNPLFIPEIRLHEANAVRAFYALGEHDAMGFSPFSIEDVRNPEEYPLTHSYRLLHQLLPLLTEKQGKGMTNGILLDGEIKGRTVERNEYTFTFRHVYTLGWDVPKDNNPWPETGAILVELSEKEYLVAGSGVAVTFGNTRWDDSITGIGFIDEINLQDGKIIPLRRMNGDQNHQGRHLRIPAGKWSIQHVKLYDYK